jgi:hypothetical protein
MDKNINDDPMLENNSYYDIDIINKANAPIQEEIDEWKEKYKNASSNMGKWYCQIRIDKLTKKLYKYENKS